MNASRVRDDWTCLIGEDLRPKPREERHSRVDQGAYDRQIFMASNGHHLIVVRRRQAGYRE